MLRQTSRKGRLQAILHDNPAGDKTLQQLADILEPEDVFEFMAPPKQMNGAQLAEAYKTGTTLDIQHYQWLLQYLNNMGRVYISTEAVLQHPAGTAVLPTTARHLHQYKVQDRAYSCITSHEGNSHIQFHVPWDMTLQETGYIEAIWELPLDRQWQSFFLVRQHRSLSPAQSLKVPYFAHPCSLLKTKVVNSQPSDTLYIVEAHHIICHVAVYKRPAGTYGLNCETMAICWSLNRGRR